MAYDPNNQNALQDNQNNRALIAHTGTADDSTTERLVSSNGALTVDIVSGDEIIVKVGTVSLVGTIPGVGLVANLNSGTLRTLGTVGVLNDGTIGQVGTIPGIGVLADGTLSIVKDGTISEVSNLADGTIASLGTIVGTLAHVGTLNKVGTVDRITRGTIDSVGTIPGVGVLANGTLSIVKDGTISSVGTMPGVGVVANLASGTLKTLGTVGVVNGGSIVVTAGTITPAIGLECGTIAVGTAEVEVTFSGVTKGIMITADHDNSREMFVGTVNVDKVGANALTRLEAGESVSIDLNDASEAIYVCGGTTGLKAFKGAVI